jgi:hypothetical protein
VNVTDDDAFAVLGLAQGASLAEVRAARRRLAFESHPDRGGDAQRMQEINRAFERAVAALTGRTLRPVPPAPSPAASPPRRRPLQWIERDEPSFTIDVLPADAFEALLIVAAILGEALVEDPPYLLEAHLHDPAPCWCRLELLPEAGGSTVILTVAGIDGPAPAAEDVRDRWIAELNQL